MLQAWDYFCQHDFWKEGIRKCQHLFHDSTAPCGAGPPHYRGFTITLRHATLRHAPHSDTHHTQTRTTLGRTPLNEWLARRRDLYLTTHNIHKRQTSMSPGGFEPAIPASERPQTYTIERAATGTGASSLTIIIIIIIITIYKNVP